MTIEAELLGQALAAASRLADSERAALLARADYHTAVRRMHLAGASLRELAQALSLSHQRVQQIVNEAGGSWWQRVWHSRNARRDAVCTACGHPPSEVEKLIAGPDVFLCDGCVTAAERTLKEARRGTVPFLLARRAACSFCGKKSAAARATGVSVCAACLGQCRAILDQRG